MGSVYFLQDTTPHDEIIRVIRVYAEEVREGRVEELERLLARVAAVQRRHDILDALAHTPLADVDDPDGDAVLAVVDRRHLRAGALKVAHREVVVPALRLHLLPEDVVDLGAPGADLVRALEQRLRRIPVGVPDVRPAGIGGKGDNKGGDTNDPHKCRHNRRTRVAVVVGAVVLVVTCAFFARTVPADEPCEYTPDKEAEADGRGEQKTLANVCPDGKNKVAQRESGAEGEREEQKALAGEAHKAVKASKGDARVRKDTVENTDITAAHRK